MSVRGAPAIAIVAALSIAVQLDPLVKAVGEEAMEGSAYERLEAEVRRLPEICDELMGARPTAVNLGNAMGELVAFSRETGPEEAESCGAVPVALRCIDRAEAMYREDICDNAAIGGHGSQWILAHIPPSPSPATALRILTHCNTGALATAGHGTALGIIRTLALQLPPQSLEVFFTESRPRFQGARLTGMELIYERIPCRMITDSMAGALLSGIRGKIAAVVVGADRITAEGAVANKIGTLALAVLARRFGVKFVVAATCSTVDLASRAGDVRIEERGPEEMVCVRGPVVRGVRKTDGGEEGYEGEAEGWEGAEEATVLTCNPRVSVWNPGFDVTPPDLVDVIVTEVGAVEKEEGSAEFDMKKVVELAAKHRREERSS